MATASNINVRGALNSDPIRNFRFLVTFLPLTVTGTGGWTPNPKVGFTSVSGLAIATESIPYREGGYNTTVHQIPGQSTFSPVTFQRGVTVGSDQNWQWMKMLFQTVSGTTFANRQSFRSDVEIAVLNHPVPYSRANQDPNSKYGVTQSETLSAEDDLVVARFRLYNAWPTTVAYSDLNAGDNALMVEQMTLVHEGMSMEWAGYNDGDGLITAASQF
jgi:phage tail-like protein